MTALLSLLAASPAYAVAQRLDSSPTAPARRGAAPRNAIHTSASASVGALDAEEGEGAGGLPFVAEGWVTGVADAAAQEEFAAAEGASGGAPRALLHGKRRPRAYTTCPRCTAISCSTGNGRRQCSGHCKGSAKLFTCATDSLSGPACITGEDQRPDPDTLSADPLAELSSLTLTAPPPFIGCANISNAHDGCPDPGTTGMLRGVEVEVMASWCEQHRHPLTCADESVDRTPFFPFGYCQCFMRNGAGSVWMRPCRLSNLDWTGPAPAGGDVPVRVSEERGLTHTTFGEREAADSQAYSFSHTFTVRGDPVTVTWDYYISNSASAIEDYLDVEGPLPVE